MQPLINEIWMGELLNVYIQIGKDKYVIELKAPERRRNELKLSDLDISQILVNQYKKWDLKNEQIYLCTDLMVWGFTASEATYSIEWNERA